MTRARRDSRSDVLPGAPGPVLREVDTERLSHSGIAVFSGWLADRGVGRFASYRDLWRWSIEDPRAFWAAVWEHFGIPGTYDAVLASTEMPGARWFTGSEVNYARHLLGASEDGDRTAVIARSETRGPSSKTFAQLGLEVAAVRSWLAEAGVGEGDCVVGYLPNIPEALVAFAAAASLGAVWATCPPEFGVRAVVSRFSQLRPKVLFAVGGYVHGGRGFDKAADVRAIHSSLPSLHAVVNVPYGPYELPGDLHAHAWDALTAHPGDLDFRPLAFDHPLYVLFSSGTTGPPKAIVHGHGGILLEHLKLHAMHLDTRPGDRVLWFTTTAWTMWNILVSGLLRRAAVVLVDGDSVGGDRSGQWRIAADAGATLLGTSPPYLMACRDLGIELGEVADLSNLRTLGVTGSPLPGEGQEWVMDQLDPAVLVNSISGGTDVCSAFVGGNPWLPVYRDELSGPCLGVDAAAFDEAGAEVLGRYGELVVRQPMPSMPVAFWGDTADQSLYRSAYFDMYPGVWRHGDWVLFRSRGSCVIGGRSDATLNRGGVRLGTAEIYSVVEGHDGIADSLVVHLEGSGGSPGTLVLFVVVHEGATFDDELCRSLSHAIRTELSLRHVPDVTLAVSAVPRTLTGKKLETPVKQILQGRTPVDVVTRGAVDRYTAIEEFASLARSPALLQRAQRPRSS